MTSALAVVGLGTALLVFWAAAFAGLGWRGGGHQERLPLALLSLVAVALAMLETYHPSPRLLAVAACGVLVFLSRWIFGSPRTGALLLGAAFCALIPIGIGAIFGTPFLAARSMTDSYEGTVILKALSIPGVLGCANMVMLVNVSGGLLDRRRRLMVRFTRLAWILSVPWLAVTLGDLPFTPHGVAATAMKDSALILMYMAHTTLSFLAIDTFNTVVAKRA